MAAGFDMEIRLVPKHQVAVKRMLGRMTLEKLMSIAARL